jgi:hypothetical protein
VAAGGRNSQSRESGSVVGSCCPPLSLDRSLRAANARNRARDPGWGRGADGARGGSGRGRRRARPLADCAPSLWSAQVVGEPPPPFNGWCSHRRGRRRHSREPDACQRPASQHFEASSCSRMLAVEDQGRQGAVARCG